MFRSIFRYRTGIALMLVSTTLVCIGQLLWKMSATQGLLVLVAGFVLYGLGAVFMILAYRFGPLSVLQPVLSLGYVLSLLLAVSVLDEVITPFKIAGIVTITYGVLLIAGGEEECPSPS